MSGQLSQVKSKFTILETEAIIRYIGYNTSISVVNKLQVMTCSHLSSLAVGVKSAMLVLSGPVTELTQPIYLPP